MSTLLSAVKKGDLEVITKIATMIGIGVGTVSGLVTFNVVGVAERQHRLQPTVQQYVIQAAENLGRPAHPVEVRIESMPTPTTLAHTTVEGASCVVHLSWRAAERPFTLAHESCHCVIEFENADQWGYKTFHDEQAIVFSEDRANACAEKLTGERPRVPTY